MHQEASLSCPNPRCGKAVRADQDDAWCHSCNEPFPGDFAARLPRLVAKQEAITGRRHGSYGSFGNPGVGSMSRRASESATPRSRAVMKRYADAYLVAGVINNVGEGIKLTAFAGALVLVIVGILTLARIGALGFFAAIVVALLFGLMLWISGVLISSQAQQLTASLDSAVSGSPFLTDEEKAEAMSLP